MDQFILQILNGLDKGSAYALIALGLTLIFGTLGVVNFAHGALFMLGAFCAVTFQRLLSLSRVVLDETQKDFLGNPLKVNVPYVNDWFGPEMGGAIIDWSVPLAILFAIPVMVLLGVIMERGLIKHFYNRPHADQILVTFGLAIVVQEVIKYYFGANQIPTPAPQALPPRRPNSSNSSSQETRPTRSSPQAHRACSAGRPQTRSTSSRPSSRRDTSTSPRRAP